jgi:hypothetical protein
MMYISPKGKPRSNIKGCSAKEEEEEKMNKKTKYAHNYHHTRAVRKVSSHF